MTITQYKSTQIDTKYTFLRTIMAHKPSAIQKSMFHPDEERPSSVPIPIRSTQRIPSRSGERSSSIPPGRHRTSSDIRSKELPVDASLDLTGLLERSGPSVVKTRTGSVLSRGFILKTDHYPSGASNVTYYPPIYLSW